MATLKQCSCLYFDDLTGEVDPECPQHREDALRLMGGTYYSIDGYCAECGSNYYLNRSWRDADYEQLEMNGGSLKKLPCALPWCDGKIEFGSPGDW